MNPSPANTPSGLTPGRTPNSGGPPKIRRPKPANPLVQRKPKARPEQGSQSKINGAVQGVERLQVNGSSSQVSSGAPAAATSQLSPAPFIDPDRAVSGFSSQPTAPYQDYDLVLSKRGEGVRWHSLRFSSRKPVDPRDPNAFTRPVRLHRRDPRDEPVKADDSKSDNALDDKERERQEIQREMRRAQREADMSQVAPTANTGGQRKLHDLKKKTQQVYGANQTAEQKARSKLRYEETLPWHLEDFDNKNVWVGSYEAALSNTFAAIYQGDDGSMRMIPLEKHYKFAPRSHKARSAMTIEEAEKSMNRINREPKIFKDKQEAQIKREQEEKASREARGLYVGQLGAGGGGSGTAKPKIKNETLDADDLDFEEDRFADDEDNPVLDFNPDETTKDAEERIKRDQLQANVFDLKEEKEYENAEAEEKKQREKQKLLGKGVKKALKRREKNYIYDSDSDANPYSEESSSDDTEAEAAREAEIAKEKAIGLKDAPLSDVEKARKVSAKKSKPLSGASSHGTNTPSGRASKHPNPPSRVPTPSLKRPGSPNLSDASGTETSSRKKIKKLHSSTKLSSSQPSHLAAPQSSASLDERQRQSSIPTKRTYSAAGSGSENEAGSGAEMSEGGTIRKTIKLRMGSTAKPSASNSRATSPAPAAGLVPTASRPPPPPPPPKAASPTSFEGMPTQEEIKEKIPAEGITVKDLLNSFGLRGKGEKDAFSKLLRKVSVYERETRLLKPMSESRD